MYSEENLKPVPPKQPATADDFYVSMEGSSNNAGGSNSNDASMDALTKRELEFIEKSKPWFHEKFGFSADSTDEIIRPTALATIALPLLFVVKGLTAPYYYGSWAQMIPQMLSLVFALISDCLPLKGGLRRKPYIWIGFLGMMICNFLLIFLDGTSASFALLFVQESCRLLLWIVGDAMAVERAWLDGGNILIVCQVMFYVGGFIRSLPQLIGFYNRFGRFLMTFLLPVIILLPFLPHLKDARVRQTTLADAEAQEGSNNKPPSFLDRVKEVGSDIFMVLQTKNTLYILGFTLLYVTVNTCVQVMNIFDGLMDWFMGDQWAYALLSAALVVLYSKFLMDQDYHRIFIISSLSILLFVGLGYVASFLLRFGNIVIIAIMVFSQLPLLLMYTALCPPGSEATMFYLMQISRIIIAKEMGVQLFFANTFNSFYWVAYILVFIPLILIRLVPKSRQHQTELQQEDLELYPMQLLGLVGFVIVFFLFMQWFWNVGYERVNAGDYDESYYSSNEFWQDWTRFQNVF